MGNGRKSGLPKGVKRVDVDTDGYRIFRTDADVSDSIGKETDEFVKNLGYMERQAIRKYTGLAYESTNPLARDPRYANSTTDEMLNDLASRIGEPGVQEQTVLTLANLHYGLNNGVVNEPFVAYRGSDNMLLFGDNNFHSHEEYTNLIGKTFRDMGNMSVSLIEERVPMGGPVRYVVQVPAGKGIGANVMPISHFDKAEGEFLLNNGAYFQVTKVEFDWINPKNGKHETKPRVYLKYIGRG